MLIIDGSQGEGGGQILRTSLALSLWTGQPFRIENIRAHRKKPGLLRQHLTAVRAASQIGRAQTEGTSLGSLQLTFAPGPPRPGSYRFAVGTAGSATLVLQTVLPALLTAPEPSSLLLEGGTHNPFAPSFDFLAKTFLPLIERMGVKVTAELERPGFFPAGGGRFRVSIEPVPELRPIRLLERGSIREVRARAQVARLPRHIAEREVRRVQTGLELDAGSVSIEELPAPFGPGNVLLIEIESDALTEVVTGFGKRGVKAEIVAKKAIKEARRYLDAGVPVGEHLADQILLPLALAGGGSFRTLPLSSHAQTNIGVLKRFLHVEVSAIPRGDTAWEVDVKGGHPV
ncbi:MAG: RNA 3'-terminal phosphate cyclase [Planctomycetota bacterium]|jgi:RNA 3'-terminal phosphate cyclase (ATP)